MQNKNTINITTDNTRQYRVCGAGGRESAGGGGIARLENLKNSNARCKYSFKLVEGHELMTIPNSKEVKS